MRPANSKLSAIKLLTEKSQCVAKSRRLQLIHFLIATVLAIAGTAEAQPTISNVYPNGTNMFQPSATLTFAAGSPAGVTNVTVALTITSLYKGALTGQGPGAVAPPMLARRMVVHLAESARKIKLLGKSKLVADLLDGKVSAVEQLYGVLHAQMIEIAQRRVTGHAPKESRVMRA